MKKIVGKRALLNLPGHHSTAAIVAEVIFDDNETPDATLKISDCDRSANIYFDFYAADEHNLENNLHKIDTLIDCLREFRKGIVKANKITKKEGL